MIYLDYNASVPLRPQAKDAMVAAFEREGNPSSPHGAGRKLRALIDGVRKEILDVTHADRVVFTSGGTEANVLALSGDSGAFVAEAFCKAACAFVASTPT